MKTDFHCVYSQGKVLRKQEGFGGWIRLADYTQNMKVLRYLTNPETYESRIQGGMHNKWNMFRQEL